MAYAIASKCDGQDRHNSSKQASYLSTWYINNLSALRLLCAP
jgi:hypothetical protein